MPVLVMREPEGSLLGDTSRLIVRRQIEYGGARKLPWGVSESAFNARDREFTYQYSSFGVPGLGLQRGLGDEAVVAPYATGLAMMIDPKAALRNFDRLQKLGARGLFGWYEALDFSPARLPEGEAMVPVRAFMAHHQGMILAAIANVLKDGMFRTCFHSNSIIQATELLLQERTPRDSRSVAAPSADEVQAAPEARELAVPAPAALHLAASRGAAHSFAVEWPLFRDVDRRRLRLQPLAGHCGDPLARRSDLRSLGVLRLLAGRGQWRGLVGGISAGRARARQLRRSPSSRIARKSSAAMAPSSPRPRFSCRPEDDAEVRRVSLTNEGNRVSEIELTTYTEVVLATAAADSAHPAFSKMFVQTEFVADSGALLATRRTRDPADPQLWVAPCQRFWRERASAACNSKPTARAFSAAGAICAMPSRSWTRARCPIRRERCWTPSWHCAAGCESLPARPCALLFGRASAPAGRQAVAMVDKHRDMAAFERAKTLAWTQAQVQLRYLSVDFEEAQAFQRIANRVLYSRFLAAGIPRHSREQPAGAVLVVAAWHLRRSADCADPDRRRDRH